MGRKRYGIRKISRLFEKYTELVAVLILGVIFCMPVLLLFGGSLADEYEWLERLRAVLLDNNEYVKWHFIPDYPTLQHYKHLLFYSPQYLVLFWNSMKMTAAILLGQLLFGLPCAWALAVYEFRGRRLLYSLYVILMLLPFQVTMLSKYLVLTGIHLMNTQAAVILTAAFSTFPVFIMYRAFSGVPKELLEVARMDGAGELRILVQLGLPIAKSGISGAFILSFLECWNMMEEPLAFIKDKALWPLSLYLPQINVAQAGLESAASVLVLAVSLFVFAIGKDSLEQGIMFTGLKG